MVIRRPVEFKCSLSYTDTIYGTYSCIALYYASYNKMQGSKGPLRLSRGGNYLQPETKILFTPSCHYLTSFPLHLFKKKKIPSRHRESLRYRLLHWLFSGLEPFLANENEVTCFCVYSHERLRGCTKITVFSKQTWHPKYGVYNEGVSISCFAPHLKFPFDY